MSLARSLNICIRIENGLKCRKNIEYCILASKSPNFYQYLNCTELSYKMERKERKKKFDFRYLMQNYRVIRGEGRKREIF